jgi:hypothetical protein
MNLDLRQQYLNEGFIFVRGLLAIDRVARLRLHSEHVLSQWRLGNAENGKQGIDSPDATVLRHLNHPGYFKDRRDWLVEILEIAADPKVLEVVSEVFDDEPLFRCTSLFFNPLEHGKDGNWHRDCQFTSDSEEQERERFDAEIDRIRKDGRVAGMQMQIALVPSEDSEYVPGSHLNWDTDDQYFIRQGEGQKHNGSNLMPGAVRMHQQPGDAAAFHAFGLHRGRYHADKFRRTLMLTYTSMSAEHREDYFTYQPWCLEPGYLDGVSSGTKKFFERFIDAYEPYWKRDANGG